MKVSFSHTYPARALACILLTAVIGNAQAPAPTFEAAVIRSASLPTPQSFQSGQFRIGSTIKGTSLDFEFVTLADLLPYAYRVKSFQIAGPDWMSQLRWNVLARLPEGSAQDQAPEMMQALLADRFKLSFHREKRQQPVYELTAIKSAIKLEAADVSGEAPADTGAVAIGFGPAGLLPPGTPPGARGTLPQDGARGGRGGAFNLGNGTRITQGSNCAIRIEFDKLTMQSLADTLTPFLDKPVVDRTELKGAYKVAMDLPIETMMGMMQSQIRNSGFSGPGQGGERGFPGGAGGGRGGFGGPGGGPLAGCIDPATAFAAGGTDASNTAIFQAVQKLGLKLQATKAPFDTIVVDRLEKTPTEN